MHDHEIIEIIGFLAIFWSSFGITYIILKLLFK